jgi:hypothetical protein
LAIDRESTGLLPSDGVEARFAKLEKHDEIERLLEELKSKQSNGFK